MRILCGVLTAFMSLLVLFGIAAAGGDLPALLLFTSVFGGSALLLLWLAGGQPLSFTATTTRAVETGSRRVRIMLRIAAGVFGVPLAVQPIVIVTDVAWKAISAARTGAPGSGDLSMGLEYLPLAVVWWTPEALAAWVLLRFAFRGRPLPPTKTALTAATPSPGPATAGNAAEPESGRISVMRPSALILLSVLLCLTVGCKRELSFDAHGYAHGTGERTYKYHTGSPQLKEDYVDGKVMRSRWFKPDGSLIQETNWKDGTGDDIFLREDGSIRARMHYVNGVAEGEATTYDAAGQVTKVETYINGKPSGQGDLPETRPAE